MIEGISNILKLAYFSELKKECSSERGFTKKNKPNRLKYMKWQVELNELSDLIQSDEECENWMVLLDAHKHNYAVQSLVYKCTLNATIKAHNLFLALIQCRVLPPQVWLPIESICQLKGARKNEHCCIIHFTVANMACGTQFNPGNWSRRKAEQELNKHFTQLYHKGIPLDEKVAILPMLTLLCTKNAKVVWERLAWLVEFPLQVIRHLKSNMVRILNPSYAQNLQLPEPDHFSLQMCLKSVQLAEMEGFVSGKNLFSYTFNLYNLSMILELLSLSTSIEWMRLNTHEFILELFDLMEMYEYDLDQNPRNIDRLNLIIVNNRLYLDELRDLQFVESYVLDQIRKHSSPTVESHNQEGSPHDKNLAIIRSLPKCSSLQPYPEVQEQDQEEEPYTILLGEKKHTILSHLLSQLYTLKIDYLRILYSIMRDCFHKVNEEPAWSEINPSFYKLQMSLLYYYLPEFMVRNFDALETKEKTEAMVGYYGVLGYLMRGNPIVYAKFDHLLAKCTLSKSNPRSTSPEPTYIKSFLSNFSLKMGLTMPTILLLLSDQFEWTENESQQYPNAAYSSVFLNRILVSKRVEWMVMVTDFVAVFHEKQCEEGGHEKWEWVTFLLTLSYYFARVIERMASSNLNQLIEKEKFLEKIYGEPAMLHGCCQEKQVMKSPQKLELVMLRLEEWEEFYEEGGKGKMMENNLSYPILKEEKKKMRIKIKGFLKRKKLEEEEDFKF